MSLDVSWSLDTWTTKEFTEIKNKNDWLESFVKKLDDGTKLEVKNTDSAKVAFKKIRQYYGIDIHDKFTAFSSTKDTVSSDTFEANVIG